VISTKLNDWMQIAAAAGVVAGLVLVAYEIRVSNRIGLEQASAQILSNYGAVDEIFSTHDAADLFVRANEGDELSRKEMVRLGSMLNTYIGALFYNWTLSNTGTVTVEGDFADYYTPTIQFYLGNEVGRRKWELDKGDWDTAFAEIVASALAASKQGNVLGELDYLRGATNSLE
jgi:hypothetical protein